jgi:CRP/FNR family transcriptional regulator, cyclic AMP receptor protein
MTIRCRPGVDLESGWIRRARRRYGRGLVSDSATIKLFNNAKESERFAAGDVIFTTGDLGDRFYVVREGTVTLSVNGRKLEDVGPGGIFGELGLLDHSPRSATATATTDCDVIPLDERSFVFHVSQTPFFALTVMRVLAERLRRESL